MFFVKMEVNSVLKAKAAKSPYAKPFILLSDGIEGHEDKLEDKDNHNFRRVINRKRCKLFPRPPKTKPHMFQMLQELTKKEEDDELIRVVQDDIVLVARIKDLNLLNKDNLQVFCDGTFKYSPRHCKQMYTFFVYNNGFYLPVAHFLLQNKFRKTYKRSLQLLKEQCLLLGFNLTERLNTGSIMLDFEVAMIKAIKGEFKNCKLKCCKFHLGQSWWRKIKELGLAKEYKQKHSKKGRWLRRVFGLSLLPHDMAEEVFSLYTLTYKHPCTKMKTFIKYIKKNYVNTNAQFPPCMWAGIKGKATNNGAEAFHKHFGELFGYLRSKPVIWQFLSCMKRFNVIKNVKMRSQKQEKLTDINSEQHILSYTNEHHNVTTLLEKLSQKNQPKTIMTRRKYKC